MLAFLLTGAAQAPVLVSGDIADAREPQIAAAGGNEFVLVFGSGNSVYESHGAVNSWSKPKLVARIDGLALGMRRGPRIAVAGKTWIVVAASLAKGKGDLLCYRSEDKGASWQGPIRVNDQEGSAAEGLDGLATTPDGTAACVWLDIRKGRQTLFGSLSKPARRAWEPNKAIYASPSGSICECCHPSIVANPAGGFTVMWRNLVDGNRDMFTGTLSAGLLLDSAAKLGSRSWKLNACPMDGGMLTAGKSNNAIWQREGSVYLGGLDGQSESQLGTGVQPWIAQGNTRIWVAWLKTRNGPLMVEEIGGKGPAEAAPVADDPVIAASGDSAVLAWSSPAGVCVTDISNRNTN